MAGSRKVNAGVLDFWVQHYLEEKLLEAEALTNNKIRSS